jgi:hypothetical protein
MDIKAIGRDVNGKQRVDVVIVGKFGDTTAKRLTDTEALELAAELCVAAGMPELAETICEI